MGMVMPNLKFILAALVAAAIVGLFSSAAMAQQPALGPGHVEKIRQNCVTAQVTLQRIHGIDVVARTLRGREYEDILRLMAAFNSRIAQNKLSIPDITEITVNLSGLSKNSFFNHYTSYANAMDKAIKMDCRKQPVEFYNQLNAVRAIRQLLKSDIDKMTQLIADYNKRVTDFRATLRSEDQ
jgi:hypothetical protein